MSSANSFVISVPVEIIEQPSTPSAPPAGTVLVYPKTGSETMFQQTSAGVESPLGGATQRTFAFFSA